MSLANDPAPPGTSEAWPDIGGIEIPRVRRLLHGDRSMFFELLSAFMRDFIDFLPPLSMPNDATAASALQKRAHRLAGDAGILGAMILREHALTVSGQLKHVPSNLQIEALQALSEEFSALHDAAQPFLTSTH
jgi:HPt (histidine-containing phosphotransfer) domain-containing protein